MRGAWIEMGKALVLLALRPSLPVRGAWIEIEQNGADVRAVLVAPRAGSVD